MSHEDCLRSTPGSAVADPEALTALLMKLESIYFEEVPGGGTHSWLCYVKDAHFQRILPELKAFDKWLMVNVIID